MKEIRLKVIENWKIKKDNTKIFYAEDITYKEAINSIEFLTQLLKNDIFAEKICIVYGQGNQPKDIHLSLLKENGIKVILYHSLLKGFWKVFSFLIASFEGVVLIQDFDKLKFVFKKLATQSQVGIYIFDRKYLDKFINLIKNGCENLEDNIIDMDLESVVYIIDTDNIESSTGILELVIIGKRASEEMIDFFNSKISDKINAK